MADRVHHRDDHSAEFKEIPLLPEGHPQSPTKPMPPSPEKPVPPPGTYVIQIPKDQVYRVPPPENASRFQRLTRRKPRRSPCCCCFCWFLALLVTFIFLCAIAAGIFYFVVRPEAPKYSIESLSIKGFNMTSSSPISPELDATVRADNPNDKIGIYYLTGSSVVAYYNDVRLANGALPAFYQGKNNVTVFVTTLKGSGIELTSTAQKALVDSQSKGEVPFQLNLRVPVKIKVGSVKTWKITVKVDCDVTVDRLTANAKIVSKNCDYGVDLW